MNIININNVIITLWTVTVGYHMYNVIVWLPIKRLTYWPTDWLIDWLAKYTARHNTIHKTRLQKYMNAETIHDTQVERKWIKDNESVWILRYNPTCHRTQPLILVISSLSPASPVRSSDMLALLACSSPSSSTMTFVLLGVLLMWTWDMTP